MAKSDLDIKITLTAEQAAAVLGQLQGGFDGLGKKGGASFTELNQGLELVKKGLDSVISATSEWRKMAAVQEFAELKLANSMKNQGDITGEGTEKLKAQASALQEVSGYGDEATISAQAMLGTFALSADEVSVLTPRLHDMAAALQQNTGQAPDLQQLAIQIGKATTGSSAALRRFGVTLSDTQAQQLDMAEGMEKVSLLAEVLDQNFAGTAETLGGSMMGRMQKSAATMGDLKENLGFLAAELTGPMNSGLKSVIGWLKGLTDRNNEAAGTVRTILQLIRPFIIILGALSLAFGVYTGAAMFAQNATVKFLWSLVSSPIGSTVLVIGALAAGIYSVATASEETIAKVREFSPVLADLMTSFQEGLQIIQGWILSTEKLNEMTLERAQDAESKRQKERLAELQGFVDQGKKIGKEMTDEQIRTWAQTQGLTLEQENAAVTYAHKKAAAAETEKKSIEDVTKSMIEHNKLLVEDGRLATSEYLKLLETRLAAVKGKSDEEMKARKMLRDEIKRIEKEEGDAEKKAADERAKQAEEFKKRAEELRKVRYDLANETAGDSEREILAEQAKYEERLGALWTFQQNQSITMDEYDNLRALAKQAHEARLLEIDSNARKTAEDQRKQAQDKERAEFEEHQQSMLEIGSAIGEAFTAAATADTKSLKAFFKSILLSAADMLDKYLTAAFLKGTLDTVFGNVGSLAIVAVAKGLLGAFKSSLTKFRTGGYTGDVPEWEPAGIVEGREYVVNAPATERNRRVLDALNAGATIEDLMGSAQPAQSRPPQTMYINVSGTLTGDGSSLTSVIERVVQQQYAESI